MEKTDNPLIDAYHDDLLPELRALIRNELPMRERYLARRTCRRWYAEDEAISLSDSMALILQEWNSEERLIPSELFLAIVEAGGMKWNPARFAPEHTTKETMYFRLVWITPCFSIPPMEHGLCLRATFDLQVENAWLVKEWFLDAYDFQCGCVKKVSTTTCTSLAELLAPTQAAWFLGTSTSWCEVRGFIDPPFFIFWSLCDARFLATTDTSKNAKRVRILRISKK